MRTRLSTFLLVAALAVTLSAQGDQSTSDPQQPTFRGGVNYVRVDMYATVDGEPVHDLRPEEIQLFEDGVPQTIEDFEHVLVPSAGPLQTRREPDGLRESREAAADPRARVFVIFLDTYHTQAGGSANIRQPLVRFLDRVLGPDDLVALMTPEMGGSDVALGRKTTVISRILEDEWWGRRARTADNDPAERMYRACFLGMGLKLDEVEARTTELMSRRREKLTLDALDDLMIHLAGLRDERKAVVVVTEGWLLHRPDPNVARVPEGVGPAPPIFVPRRPGPLEQPRNGISSDPIELDCEIDRNQLALVDHELRLRQITEEANRGNVTFYPVHPRGLVVFDAPIGPDKPPSLAVDSANLRTRLDSMRALAWDTDGEALVNTNNIDAGLERIADDLSSYYLLGYSSTNTQLDGRFREITVRVTRPGIRVRARRGYRGRTPEEVLSSVAPAADPRRDALEAALNTVAGLNARSTFRIRSSAWTRADSAELAGTVWIVGELEYRTRKELAWTAGAEAEVVVVSADGTPIVSTRVAIPAGQGTFEVRVPDTGTLAPGEYAARVRLTPESGSDAVLSDTIRVIVPDRAIDIGEAVLWRRGPSTGPQYLRTADPRFQRNERIRLELATTGGSGAATARLLDRAGNPVEVPVRLSERVDAAAGIRWIVADATLAPLGAGDYAIEVTLGDTAQVTGFRVIP